MKSATFSCPGLGAQLVLNDAGEIVGGGLFGPGFDGSFRTLTVASAPNEDGTRDVYLPSADGIVSDWPTLTPYRYDRIGSCVMALSADGNTLDIAFSLDRYALGYPKIDFSPPAPPEVTGSVTLSRLA